MVRVGGCVRVRGLIIVGLNRSPKPETPKLHERFGQCLSGPAMPLSSARSTAAFLRLRAGGGGVAGAYAL